MLEDAERDQCDDALAVGRNFVDGVAAVIMLQRAYPVGLVRGEVRYPHRATVLLRVSLDFFGQLAAVERGALGGRDFLQGRGVVGPLEHLAGRRRTATRHEGFGEAGLDFQLRHLRRPLPGNGRRDHESLASVADRRLEQFLEGQLAEFPVQLDPGGDAARHTHRIPAAHRHLAFLGEVLGRPCRGRTARGVEAVQLLAVPDDRVGVRADAVGHGLHQRQRDRGGEDRVHRAASRGEHLYARLRGERLRSADDVFREQRLARPVVGELPGKGNAHGVIVSGSSALACDGDGHFATESRCAAGAVLTAASVAG